MMTGRRETTNATKDTQKMLYLAEIQQNPELPNNETHCKTRSGFTNPPCLGNSVLSLIPHFHEKRRSHSAPSHLAIACAGAESRNSDI
jgi:hypothetical protein